MRRVLAGAFTVLAIVLLVAFALPLESVYTRSEENRLTTEVLSKAYRIAADPARAEVDESMRVVIVDLNGLSTYDSASLGITGVQFSGQAEIATALDGRVAVGEHQDPSVASGAVLYAAVPVWRGGQEPVGVVRVTMTREALDAHLTRVRLSLLLGAIASLIVAVLSGMLISSWMRRAVLSVLRAGRAHENGDLLERADDRQGPKEIREIARQANSTAQALLGHLDARGRFAADAAHQLRTPLSALRLRLEVLALEHPGEDTTSALTAAERLEEVASDLLRLARGEQTTQSVEVVPLGVVITEAARRWVEMGQSHGVTISANPSTLSARAPRAHVEACVDEFIANALDASRHGGRILLHLEQSGDAVVLCVDDDGVGLGEMTGEELFEPFRRRAIREHAIGGTGLGLAIVRAHARAWGGEARLERGERGTRASLCFPSSTSV